MEKPFSIGFITSGLTSLGGIERYSSAMVQAYTKRADITRVIVLTHTDSQNDAVEADVFRDIIPGRYGFRTQWSVFSSAMRHLRGCDVIHCAVETYGPGAALASLVLRKPLFITLAGSYSVPPKGNSAHAFLKRQMMRFMYWQAAQIMTMSERNTTLIKTETV